MSVANLFVGLGLVFASLGNAVRRSFELDSVVVGGPTNTEHLAYHFAPANTASCDFGEQVSEQDCQAVGEALLATDGKMPSAFRKKLETHYPKGCYVNTRGNFAQWNDHPHGRGHPGAAVVCTNECSFRTHNDGFPDGVAVIGAGTAKWNGCYERDDSGNYQHQKHNGSIYAYGGVWRIAEWDKFTAYMAPNVTSDTVPLAGWEFGLDSRTPVGMGDAPAPFIQPFIQELPDVKEEDEKQCDNWRADGVGSHRTLADCVVKCRSDASCVACSIGWSLNDYKEMHSCPLITKRATYGQPSLWSKAGDAEKQCDNWRVDGVGKYPTLADCVVQCRLDASCVACSIGWSLNDYKEMHSCPRITKRATYGQPSLWSKPVHS